MRRRGRVPRRHFLASIEASAVIGQLDDDLADLDHSFDRAIGVIREIDDDPDEALASIVRDHVRHLARYLDEAHARLIDLESSSGRRRHAKIAWPARRLLGISTRLLPPRHRVRYSEEFTAELQELATRRAQLRCAMRQLLRAPSLRAELNAARRRSASA